MEKASLFEARSSPLIRVMNREREDATPACATMANRRYKIVEAFALKLWNVRSSEVGRLGARRTYSNSNQLSRGTEPRRCFLAVFAVELDWLS
jgi:hypothetical protein